MQLATPRARQAPSPHSMTRGTKLSSISPSQSSSRPLQRDSATLDVAPVAHGVSTPPKQVDIALPSAQTPGRKHDVVATYSSSTSPSQSSSKPLHTDSVIVEVPPVEHSVSTAP